LPDSYVELAGMAMHPHHLPLCYGLKVIVYNCEDALAFASVCFPHFLTYPSPLSPNTIQP